MCSIKASYAHREAFGGDWIMGTWFPVEFIAKYDLRGEAWMGQVGH